MRSVMLQINEYDDDDDDDDESSSGCRRDRAAVIRYSSSDVTQ